MKPSEALEAHRQAIREIAARHRVRNVRVFGSVLNGTDTEGSDLDLLVDPTGETALFDIGAIQHELSSLRFSDSKVDLEVVWRTIQTDLPGLERRIKELRASL